MNDMTSFKAQITSTIKVLCFILLPLTVGLITLRSPIVRLAFQRGAFDEQGVSLTSIALTYYAIGMIGFGMQEILNKSFFALKDTKTPTKFAIISVAVNIILNLVLVRTMDLAGLALATSIAAISNGMFLYWALTRKVGKIDTIGIIKNLVKILVSVAVMAIFTNEAYQIAYSYVEIGRASWRERV